MLNFPHLTRLAEVLLIFAVGFLLLTIWVGYLDTERFSIAAQISAHIGLILAATLVKVAYVLRCIGRHGQQLEV